MVVAFDLQKWGLTASAERPSIPGGPQTIDEMLTRARREFPQREALVDRHARYDYAALDRAVNRAANLLLSRGVAPYDRVAASITNGADLVIAFLATIRAGAIWVGINRKLAPPEKRHILLDSGAKLFLGDAEMVAQVAALEIPALDCVTVTEGGAWLGENDAALSIVTDSHAPAAIAYTSGTSGFPKGAVHSQHNLLLVGALTIARGDFDHSIRHGSFLPLTILNLMVLSPLVAFQQGSAAIIVDHASAQTMAEWIGRERIGYFAGVPTQLHDLLSSSDVRAQDLVTLKRVLIGGADSPEVLCNSYRDRFGTKVIIGYGMTEAPTAVTVTDGSVASGLCGKALGHLDVFVVDDRDQRLPAGELGEICVRPASDGPLAGIYTPMLGYWNQPDATARTMRGDMFHTGDIGQIDERGDLYIRGRKSDLILRGGANVYPAEVERVISSDNRIAACAVLGRPDERLGERVVAFVECKPGHATSSDELRALCEKNLARYKVPEEFFFVPGFERNSMGKIVKRDLLKSQ